MVRIEELVAKALKKVEDDRYLLSVLVAKRAKEILESGNTTVNIVKKGYKPTDIALYEIAEGLINVKTY